MLIIPRKINKQVRIKDNFNLVKRIDFTHKFPIRFNKHSHKLTYNTCVMSKTYMYLEKYCGDESYFKYENVCCIKSKKKVHKLLKKLFDYKNYQGRVTIRKRKKQIPAKILKLSFKSNNNNFDQKDNLIGEKCQNTDELEIKEGDGDENMGNKINDKIDENMDLNKKQVFIENFDNILSISKDKNENIVNSWRLFFLRNIILKNEISIIDKFNNKSFEENIENNS